MAGVSLKLDKNCKLVEHDEYNILSISLPDKDNNPDSYVGLLLPSHFPEATNCTKTFHTANISTNSAGVGNEKEKRNSNDNKSFNGKFSCRSTRSKCLSKKTTKKRTSSKSTSSLINSICWLLLLFEGVCFNR